MNTTKKNKLYAPFAFSVAAMSGLLFTVSCTGMGKHAMMGSDDNNNQSCNKGGSNSQVERGLDITKGVSNSAQHRPTDDEKKQVTVTLTSDQVREKGSQFHQAIIDNNENIFNEILNADESIINYVANVCFDENENKFYLDTNDQPNNKRYAPLTMAIIYSRLHFVKKMLASEKTKFYHKEADLQPVHHAASKEDGQALDMLLSDKRCLTDDFINATDIHGHTPTQAAVLRCKTDNFKKLLKHEYNNLNFTDKDKNNPSLLLHLVVDAAIAYQNNPNKIKELQAITTEILDNPKIDLNQKNAKGRTALWRVAAQPPGKLDEKITRDISMHKRVNPNASAKPGASDDMATVYKVAHMQCNEVVKKCLDERAKTEHVNRRLSYRYALWRSYNKWFMGYKSN